jgi:hypothetical protein
VCVWLCKEYITSIPGCQVFLGPIFNEIAIRKKPRPSLTGALLIWL